MSNDADKTSDPGAISLGLVFGALLAPAALGISAAPVALPAMGADLGVRTAGTAWVVASFTLTMSIGNALGGRLADVRGSRLPLLLSAALLIVGTVTVVGAPVFPMVVVGRLIQGAGSGIAGMLAFDLATQLFTDARRRATAVGVTGSVVGIVSGAGALLGGLITDLVGWRGALALPCLSVIAAAQCLRYTTPRGAEHRTLDAAGAAWCLGVTAGVVLLLQSRSMRLSVASVLILGGCVLLAAIGLTRHVRRHPEGFLPVAVTGNSRVLRGAVIGFVLFAGYVVIQFAAPRFLVGAHSLSPTQVGLTLLPAGLASAVVSRYAGVIAASVGPLRLAGSFTAVSATGLLLASVGNRSVVFTVPALALCVAAYTGGQSAIMSSIPTSVPHEYAGITVGVLQLLFVTGGSVGSAAVGGLSTVLSLPSAVAVLSVLPLIGALIVSVMALRPSAEPESLTPPAMASSSLAR